MTTNDLEEVKDVMQAIEELIENNDLLRTYLQAEDIHLMTIPETAKYLKISESTLRQGDYPGRIKKKGVVYYDKKEVNKWLKN